MSTWKDKVLELERRGWTLTALAEKSGASISAIADLKQGRTKEPRASVGLELHHLYSTGARSDSRARAGNRAKAVS